VRAAKDLPSTLHRPNVERLQAESLRDPDMHIWGRLEPRVQVLGVQHGHVSPDAFLLPLGSPIHSLRPTAAQ